MSGETFSKNYGATEPQLGPCTPKTLHDITLNHIFLLKNQNWDHVLLRHCLGPRQHLESVVEAGSRDHLITTSMFY